MSRTTIFIGELLGQGPTDQELQVMQSQSSDLYALMRAKEILCELWKESRIDIHLRAMGEEALSGAILAIEHPEKRYIGPREAKLASLEQWYLAQERARREF